RTRRTDRERREGYALHHRLRLRVSRRGGQGVRMARQGDRARQRRPDRDRDGKRVRENPKRSALAPVTAQDRRGIGAAGEDRVQSGAAARCGGSNRVGADDSLVMSAESRLILPTFWRWTICRLGLFFVRSTQPHLTQ